MCNIVIGSWRLWYLFFVVFSCDCLEGSNWPEKENGSVRPMDESFYRLRGAFRRSPKLDINFRYLDPKSQETWHGRELEIVDSGPGSKPPKCETKCGKCTPCTPVRVPVQPGPHKTSEYYPEAWRCRCKGKLYMP